MPLLFAVESGARTDSQPPTSTFDPSTAIAREVELPTFGERYRSLLPATALGALAGGVAGALISAPFLAHYSAGGFETEPCGDATFDAAKVVALGYGVGSGVGTAVVLHHDSSDAFAGLGYALLAAGLPVGIGYFASEAMGSPVPFLGSLLLHPVLTVLLTPAGTALFQGDYWGDDYG